MHCQVHYDGIASEGTARSEPRRRLRPGSGRGCCERQPSWGPSAANAAHRRFHRRTRISPAHPALPRNAQKARTSPPIASLARQTLEKRLLTGEDPAARGCGVAE
jgi:hypothetical protein